MLLFRTQRIYRHAATRFCSWRMLQRPKGLMESNWDWQNSRRGNPSVSTSNSPSVPRMQLHKFVHRIVCMEPVVAGDRSAWRRMLFQVLHPKCTAHCRSKWIKWCVLYSTRDQTSVLIWPKYLLAED